MSDDNDQREPRLHYMQHYDQAMTALGAGDSQTAIAHGLLGLMRLFQIPEAMRR
jgi:hypothetical protein